MPSSTEDLATGTADGPVSLPNAQHAESVGSAVGVSATGLAEEAFPAGTEASVQPSTHGHPGNAESNLPNVQSVPDERIAGLSTLDVGHASSENTSSIALPPPLAPTGAIAPGLSGHLNGEHHDLDGSASASRPSQGTSNGPPSMSPAPPLAAEKRPSAPRMHTAKDVLSSDGWGKEIAACCLSVATFGATIGIFAYFDGKPVPDIGHGLTLNGLIAVLTAITKPSIASCLSAPIGQLKWNWFAQKRRPLNDLSVFDRASRSIEGAVQLLQKLPRLYVSPPTRETCDR
jgi:hypothetical protein